MVSRRNASLVAGCASLVAGSASMVAGGALTALWLGLPYGWGLHYASHPWGCQSQGPRGAVHVEVLEAIFISTTSRRKTAAPTGLPCEELGWVKWAPVPGLNTEAGVT